MYILNSCYQYTNMEAVQISELRAVLMSFSVFSSKSLRQYAFEEYATLISDYFVYNVKTW
jgi:hypothetical protein